MRFRRSDISSTAAQMLDQRKTVRTDAEALAGAIEAQSAHMANLRAALDCFVDFSDEEAKYRAAMEREAKTVFESLMRQLGVGAK